MESVAPRAADSPPPPHQPDPNGALRSPLLPLGIGLVAFPAGLTTLVAMTLLAGGSVGPWQAPLALALAVAATASSRRSLRPGEAAWRLAILSLAVPAIVVAAGWLGSRVYDVSWDGQAYHQEAILQLAAGWNPIRDAAFPQGDPPYAERLVHWAKGPWYCAAAVYRSTGSIEAGKLFHGVLLLAAFCWGWSALRLLGVARGAIAVWLAGLAAFNPVAISQAPTFYVDGLLSSWLVVLAAALVLCWQRFERWPLFGALAAAVCCTTVKFTGVPYAALGLGAFVAGKIAVREYAVARRAVALFLPATLLGAALLGWAPYVTNAVRNGHPFFPMAGPGAYFSTKVMEGQAPADFASRGTLEKLARSLASPVEDVMGAQRSRSKPFGSLTRQEFAAFAVFYQVRLAGWGPWFGPALLFAAALTLALLLKPRRGEGLTLALLLTPLLLPSLLTSVSWWARFNPQLALVPVVVAAAACSTARAGLRAASVLLLCVLSVNVALPVWVQDRSVLRQSRALARRLDEVRRSGQTIAIDFTGFPSNRQRLLAHGISYRTVSAARPLACRQPQQLPGTWGVSYCVEQPGI
jgi:hypothetical protein